MLYAPCSQRPRNMEHLAPGTWDPQTSEELAMCREQAVSAHHQIVSRCEQSTATLLTRFSLWKFYVTKDERPMHLTLIGQEPFALLFGLCISGNNLTLLNSGVDAAEVQQFDVWPDDILLKLHILREMDSEAACALQGRAGADVWLTIDVMPSSTHLVWTLTDKSLQQACTDTSQHR